MCVLRIIFALYILALAFIPCGDVMECNVPANDMHTASAHDSHEHETEACTPFCICSCCAQVVTVAFNKIEIKKPVSPSLQSLPHNINELISGSYGSIWQPPKIA